MARGGRRPGAGRPKGLANKLAREITQAAMATGLLPHQILLALGRGEPVQGFEGVQLAPEDRIECLKAAAPYFAPRLVAAAVKQMPQDYDPYAELVSSVKPSRGLPFKATALN